MSAYTDWPGAMVPIAGTDAFTATIALRWEIGRKGSGLWIEVPAGFRHDVSVPRWLRWLMNPLEPRYQRFARLHDWMLEDGWSRVQAAGISHQALVADGVSALRRLGTLLAIVVYRYQ